MIHKDRVLVVDDEPINIRIMAATLEKAGYEVFRASDCDTALRMIREENPHILLLDVMMPVMGGIELTKLLRNDPETNAIPIILVTSLERTEDKVEGLNAGADDFLTKPVIAAELLARVRSLLKLKRLNDDALSRYEPASYDISGADNSRRGKSIILIVEDDKIVAKISGSILSAGGYEVITAATILEAETVLDGTVPDLILLDLILPDGSGIDLLASLRTKPEFENIPVIIVSSLTDLETRVKGIETGADDYLVKPVHSLELMARVKSNLHKYEISQRLKRNADKLFVLSITDPLTGLYNRQYLDTVLEREIAASRRNGSVFSLLLFDIDHFKEINDTLGHVVGDSVLRELGRILKNDVRINDVAARYGGDEFVVMLLNTSIDTAMTVAEKLRLIVGNSVFASVVTISIGVAQVLPEDSGMESIIKRADEALYVAKRKGRNRVEVS